MTGDLEFLNTILEMIIGYVLLVEIIIVLSLKVKVNLNFTFSFNGSIKEEYKKNSSATEQKNTKKI